MKYNSSQLIADYTVLAEAAYSDFSRLIYQEAESSPEKFEREEHDAIMYEDPGTKEKLSDRPQAFAQYVTSRYDVVAHWKDRGKLAIPAKRNQSSGFSATLFREMEKDENGNNKKPTDRYVLAMRGTADGKDLLTTDGGDIVNDGLAHHQIVDMYNFWQQIKAKKGEPYDVMQIVDDPDSIGVLAPLQALLQNKSADQGFFIDSGSIKRIVASRSDKLYKEGDERRFGLGINVGKVVTTGHSLGGHLSAAFSRLFPNETEHSYMINGAGFGAKLNPVGYIESSAQWNIASVFASLGGTDHFDKNKITNLIGDKNIDFVANNWFVGLKQPGQTVETFIEKASLYETFGHASGQMSDAMVVASLFAALDNRLDNSVQTIFEKLMPLFKAAAGQENLSLERLVYMLDKLLHGNNAVNISDPDNRNGLYERVTALKNTITKLRQKNGNFRIELLTDHQDLLQKATQDNEEGKAYRYALRELNPFAVIGADYSQHGNLGLHSSANLGGMTEAYLNSRKEMLNWQNIYGLFNVKYDKRLNDNTITEGLRSSYHLEIVNQIKEKLPSYDSLNMLPANSKGDWIYEDTALGLKLDIDGRNPTDLSRHYIRFGGNAEGNLSGGDLEDRLFGDNRDNTLAGNQGNDYMEGGIGNDTYYIEDSDTVVDSDGKGKIIFRESGLASAILPTVQAGHFVRSEGETEMWNSADENGKTDNRLTARKIGNDLEIWRSNSINDKVLIKNFFRQASAANNGSLSLLGITLADAVPTEERPFLSAITYTGEANLYNTFNLSGQQRFNIIGGSKDDLVFATGTQAARIDAGAGNDRIYGSYGADTIYGGSGSDYINGSPGVIAGTNRTAEQQAEDRDFLVGGAGRDVVVGMAGDDIIHTGEVGEHLLTAGSGEAGDLASGGLGDDKIYGSIANDLLAGSEGGDTVYGGAGDDVILGDALYRLASRSLTVYQESTITGPEYGPGIIGTGYIAPPSHHTPRVGMEHNYSNGKWAHQVTNVASRSHPDMEKWTVSIDREKGDYAFSSPIPATNEDHRLAAGGGADYLYGGYGNDLIIGQDGNDFLYGESGNDILWGDDNRDLSVAGDDYLDGGDDNDTLYGGGGADTLIGGRGSDTLYGGTGFDTYLFHASDLKYGNDIDTIDDEDGQGRIVIDGAALDGLTWQRQDGGWRSGRFSLSQTGSELHVAVDGWQNGITVRNFANGTLGLNLPAQQPEPPAAQPKQETPNPRLPETPALPDLPAETKPQEPSVNPDLPETPILPTNPSNTEQPLTPLPPNNPGNPPANAEPATPPAEPNHPIPTETPVLPTNPSNTGGQIPPMLPDNPAYSVAPAPVVPPKPVKTKRRLSVFGRRKEQVVNSYSSWKQKAEDKVSSGILSWKRRRAAKKAATATAPLQPQQPATILPPSHSPFKRHRKVAASVGTSAALAHIPQQAVALTHAMAAFGNGQGSAASGTVSVPPNPAAILTTPSV